MLTGTSSQREIWKTWKRQEGFLLEKAELLAERGKYRKGKRIQKGWRQIACWERSWGPGGGLEVEWDELGDWGWCIYTLLHINY